MNPGLAVRSAPQVASLCRQVMARVTSVRTHAKSTARAALAAIIGQVAPDVTADPAEAQEIAAEAAALSEQFERSIAPRSLSAQLLDRSRLILRVQAFLTRRRWNDVEVERWVRQTLHADAKMTPAQVTHFLHAVPVARLRTYTSGDLAAVAGHFARWYPLIRYLSDPAFRTGATQSLDAELGRVREELAPTLRRHCPRARAGYDAADALQEAISEAIGAAADPRRGYCYEGRFPGWLFITAHRKLLARGRDPEETPVGSGPSGPLEQTLSRRPIAVAVDEGSEMPRSSVPAAVQALPDAEVRARYLIVESVFQRKAVPRVKQIWEEMARGDDGGEEGEAGKAQGEMPAGSVATIRRRLRQRLHAFGLVRDEVCGWSAAPGGQKPMLCEVRKLCGLDDRDTPTLNGLAALAAVSRGEPNLGWALLARLLINRRLPPREAAREVLPVLSAFGPLDAAMQARLERGVAWMESRHNRKRLSVLSGEARRRGHLPLVTAIWQAKVLQELPPSETLARLGVCQDTDLSDLIARL